MYVFRHSKQRVIYEGNQRITGLAFKSMAKNPVLFVATEGEIVCITLMPKDKEQKVILNHLPFQDSLKRPRDLVQGVQLNQ